MFNSFDFPESYRVNSSKEKLALRYAENFRKQFVHLYRDRKPLLLNPLNELQVEAGWTLLNSLLNAVWLLQGPFNYLFRFIRLCLIMCKIYRHGLCG